MQLVCVAKSLRMSFSYKSDKKNMKPLDDSHHVLSSFSFFFFSSASFIVDSLQSEKEMEKEE